MKLQIRNFIIQEDRSWFILEEWGDKINPKDWTSTYWLKEQTYPATMAKCFEKILHKIKLNKTETLELNEYVEEIKKINEEFINEIKLLWIK